MKKYVINYRAVNARAAILYRETVEKYPDARNRVTWALCMKEAAREYREEVKNYTARAKWESMSGEKQLDMLKRAAAKMPEYMMSVERVDPVTGEKVYRVDKTVLWMTPENRGGQGLIPWKEAVDTVAAEAWIIVAEAMESYDGSKPLIGIVYAAARKAVSRLDRLYHDAPRTKRIKADGKQKQINLAGGGAGTCEWNDMSAARAPYSLAWKAESPEAAYISREAVEALAKDETDKRIIANVECGRKQVEIAARLGISQPAVAKRIKGMKNRRIEQIGSAEAWLRGYNLK